MGTIELNGGYYVTDGPIVQTYVARQSSPYRLQGVQARKDDPSVNRYVHTSFPLGIGWSRMSRETGRGVGGLLDSTCWTALGPITIAKLLETQTHATPADVMVKMVDFKGNLWGIFEELYSGAAITETNSRVFGATSDDWTGGGQINLGDTNAIGVRAFDAVVHKNSIFVVGTGGLSTVLAAEEVVYGICSSTDGVTWADAGLIGFPDNTGTNRYVTTAVTRRNTYSDDRARACSFGLTLLVALYRDPSATDGDGLIEVLSSTDSGANWVSDVTVPSGSGPKRLLDWMDLSATRRAVLITAEGVYAIDTANNLFTLIYALDGNANNGRFAEVGNDGALYIGTSRGKVLRLFIPDTNVLEVTVIGPPGDGLATAPGSITCMCRTPSEWLMLGTSAGQVLMVDTSVIHTDTETGTRFMPWHYLTRDASNGVVLALAYSTADNSVERLHLAVGNNITTYNYHVELPLTNPDESSAIKFEASGVLRLPVDDMGDPQTNSTILQGLVDADSLSATTAGEYIAHQYGLDGSADTTTTLGNYLSGDKDLSFGSGAGVAGKKIGNRLTLNRDAGSNLHTPKLREFEIQAHNILIGRRAWTFTVDIEKTVQSAPPTVSANTPPEETIITNLLAVATSTTLVTFTIGRMTQTRVRVAMERPPVLNLQLRDSVARQLGQRTGTVTVTVEEAI